MRKFNLYVVEGGELTQEFHSVEGFANADSKAKEILKNIWPNCPCDDTYIECVETGFGRNFDRFVLQKDCYGDVCWNRLVMGEYGPLCIRFPTHTEEEELDIWRNEDGLHVSDLNEDELKELRSQVCIGSCYFSDYTNHFYISENEVSNVCESYEAWCESENIPDTPDNFAYYVLEIA